MKKNIRPTDFILLLLSLFFLLGIIFIFHPCGPKEDGSWMFCHWSGQMEILFASIFVLLSIIRFFFSEKAKAALSLSFIPLSIAAALVPGKIIPLCMMKDMRCHAVMRPAVIVLSAVIALISLTDTIILLTKKSK